MASEEAPGKRSQLPENESSRLPRIDAHTHVQETPGEAPARNSTSHGLSDTNPPTSDEDPIPPRRTKRSMAQTATVMTSLCACVFLSALEVTIVTTALPTIASHFASDSGYTWIGTSYVLAQTASTPSWGKVSDIWGRKPILLIANAIFFGGSLLCALVDDFKAFIAGRAVQGLGAAGMQTMVNICISDMFSQRDRGLYYGLLSMVWTVASGIGPVMGGAFTDQVR